MPWPVPDGDGGATTVHIRHGAASGMFLFTNGFLSVHPYSDGVQFFDFPGTVSVSDSFPTTALRSDRESQITVGSSQLSSSYFDRQDGDLFSSDSTRPSEWQVVVSLVSYISSFVASSFVDGAGGNDFALPSSCGRLAFLFVLQRRAFIPPSNYLGEGADSDRRWWERWIPLSGVFFRPKGDLTGLLFGHFSAGVRLFHGLAILRSVTPTWRGCFVTLEKGHICVERSFFFRFFRWRTLLKVLRVEKGMLVRCVHLSLEFREMCVLLFLVRHVRDVHVCNFRGVELCEFVLGASAFAPLPGFVGGVLGGVFQRVLVVRGARDVHPREFMRALRRYFRNYGVLGVCLS